MEAFFLHDPRDEYRASKDRPFQVLERLIHCIWSEQLFRKNLIVEGKTLLISSPGWWNLEAGPDFRNAELMIGGIRVCGDVEIHLNSGDWNHHGHDKDPRYNSVVMHVVLYSSGVRCRKQNGEELMELELKDHLLEELRLLRQRIPIHQFPFGPESNVRLCRKFLEEHDEVSVCRILDSAGDLRMRRKKERYREVLHSAGFEQAFYEGMMEGMGYKQSRYAFRELARRVPIAELLQWDFKGRKGIDSMAAVLLGTAGLIEELSQLRLQHPDPETSHYVNELCDFWQKASPQFAARRLIGFCWYPSSTRPANFPARRLTAVAAFFHYFHKELLPLLMQPLQNALPERKLLSLATRKWLDLFGRPMHVYWSYHFHFERRTFFAPRRLIGMDRGRILVINVVLPLLLAAADSQQNKDLERIVHSIYRGHPKLCPNSITRLMEHRLFGPDGKARSFVTTAHRQQALHHFFYDFCDNREASCSRCELKDEAAAKAQAEEGP
jgi:Protein of unknown function (DUF2851)